MSIRFYKSYTPGTRNRALSVFNDITKTKNFVNICNDCMINLDQKLLIVVLTKTLSLKLATQNLKNVELINVANLNTISLLKAKQIILTPLAINYIKESYCD